MALVDLRFADLVGFIYDDQTMHKKVEHELDREMCFLIASHALTRLCDRYDWTKDQPIDKDAVNFDSGVGDFYELLALSNFLDTEEKMTVTPSELRDIAAMGLNAAEAL